MFIELYKRIKFWNSADRLGLDIPTLHWKLYLKSTMISLCKSKFKEFGTGAEFRPGAFATSCSKIRIGKRVVIRPGTMLMASPNVQAEIIIEDDVMIGSGVHIYVSNHRYDNPNIPIIDQGAYESESVVLKKGCWVGANAIILPGVNIGENAVIGAGSIVTKSIPDRVLAVGNPARVLRRVDEGRV